LPKAASKT